MSYPTVLTKRMNDHPSDSHTIERYEATGGYVQAKAALDMTRDGLVEMVKRGRERRYRLDRGRLRRVLGDWLDAFDEDADRRSKT